MQNKIGRRCETIVCGRSSFFSTGWYHHGQAYNVAAHQYNGRSPRPLRDYAKFSTMVTQQIQDGEKTGLEKWCFHPQAPDDEMTHEMPDRIIPLTCCIAPLPWTKNWPAKELTLTNAQMHPRWIDCQEMCAWAWEDFAIKLWKQYSTTTTVWLQRCGRNSRWQKEKTRGSGLNSLRSTEHRMEHAVATWVEELNWSMTWWKRSQTVRYALESIVETRDPYHRWVLTKAMT